ncbi:MAG: metallophosphoesterase [Vicinamibacterales bacterium]
MKSSRSSHLPRQALFACTLAVLVISQGWWRPARAADTTLVAVSAPWRYLDNGTDAGTAWREPSFNDSGWASGPAQLGYGDGDEVTVVGFGPDSSAKYTTTYFRHAFTVSSPSSYSGLTLRVLRDDGAIVYLNGTEIFRSNMPAGAVTSATLATVAVAGADESTFFSSLVSPALLADGNNVLAVEIHQSGGTSSDISFALELLASDGVNVTRGPYLQTGTPASVIVRWRTDVATDSRVRFGTSAGVLTSAADNSALTTEHEVLVSGLQPATPYFYSVGTSQTALAGDTSYTFTTSPVTGTSRPTRIWVLGDSGTANANAAAVRDAYLNFTGARGTDLWLMLGDNAYETGTDAEFQSAVFNMYPTVLRQSALWPTLGNHDGQTADSATGAGPYYDIFTLPKNAEAGGIASGTEAYYSFDYGSIHFICLESFETNRAANGPMMTWLRNDVLATTQPWVVAFWHHPPYTKGSHNSDTETELIQMRENALPILEAAGVDLVLTGHSHSYERSFLIDGHYRLSSTFDATMKVDGGSGRTDGTGAYHKPGPGPQTHAGAVYAVAGSSGQTSGGTLNHPAMFISINSLGSMVLDVDGSRLDARFLSSTGAVLDYFTIVKDAPPSTAPAGPTGLTATASSSSVVALAWADNASDEQGFVVERSSGEIFTEIATLGPNVTSFTDQGLSASTTYSYQVRAFNAAGANSSNVATVTTPAAPVSLAAPSGLVARAGANGQVTLTWADNSNNEDRFEIQRSSDGATFAAVTTVGANVQTFADSALARRQTYWYRVRAGAGTATSAFSSVARVKTR